MRLTPATLDQLDFTKDPDGLLPAVVQHVETDEVLMLGYVTLDSLAETFHSEHITFYSRSKGRLWTKGESSGNFLNYIEGYADCDRDAVLLLAQPEGPTCHTGAKTCFEEASEEGGDKADEKGLADKDTSSPYEDFMFLRKLETLLHDRQPDPDSKSYTARLLAKGPMKVAQKVGEEGVEMALEAVAGTDELFTEEAADLLYHYLLLLRVKGQHLSDVVEVLRQRHR